MQLIHGVFRRRCRGEGLTHFVVENSSLWFYESRLSALVFLLECVASTKPMLKKNRIPDAEYWLTQLTER
jgi:hypothetical protein